MIFLAAACLNMGHSIDIRQFDENGIRNIERMYKLSASKQMHNPPSLHELSKFDIHKSINNKLDADNFFF
jgi:hypothetical protein